jgi:hypothetical protein
MDLVFISPATHGNGVRLGETPLQADMFARRRFEPACS